MTRMTRWGWLGTLAVATLCAGPLAAQNKAASIAGDWQLTYSTPRGENTATIHFTQQNDSLGGTADMRRGSIPVTGTVQGDSLTFSMAVGREDRRFSLVFTGRVQGDSAKGTMRTPRGENPWTAVRARP